MEEASHVQQCYKQHVEGWRWSLTSGWNKEFNFMCGSHQIDPAAHDTISKCTICSMWQTTRNFCQGKVHDSTFAATSSSAKSLVPRTAPRCHSMATRSDLYIGTSKNGLCILEIALACRRWKCTGLNWKIINLGNSASHMCILWWIVWWHPPLCTRWERIWHASYHQVVLGIVFQWKWCNEIAVAKVLCLN